ncbi:MAG: methyltransferase domain-containing protein [Pirellulaceae bacterium]|nr:methyltransferase domain-containing protein [Planctomycetales bacterium]
MRRDTFELLQPVCPVCRGADQGEWPLRLDAVMVESEQHILEGLLVCSNSACQREYPIIDGIPILVPNIRAYISDNIMSIVGRRDFSEVTDSVLGDCCGPGSMFDVLRQHLSSYAEDHYGELDTARTANDTREQNSGVATALRDLVNAADTLTDETLPVDPPPDGPLLDVGCSVGRTTFELAAMKRQPVVGIDLNFSMLRTAAAVLQRGEVAYPVRRVGLVYDRRSFAVDFPHAERVDFWACDALALPFRDDTFAGIVGLNVLDCVLSPVDFLRSLGRVVQGEGNVLLSCPFDWAPSATPVEQWLGGHSQRAVDRGSSEAVLQRWLGSNDDPWGTKLRLLDAAEGPVWNVRLHDRSQMQYRNYRIILKSRKHRIWAMPKKRFEFV